MKEVRLSKKAKKEKVSVRGNMVAKLTHLAQQSVSHALNTAAKKGWRLRPQARASERREASSGQPR